MIISVASLTLRFYRYNGWTKAKVRKLLVNPKIEITYRKDESDKAHKELLGDLSYYAVYEDSGFKVFKKSEMDKHIIEDKQNFGANVEWYINEKE